MAKPAGHAVYDGRTVSFEGDGSVASGEIVELSGNEVAGHGEGTAIGVVSDKAPEEHEQGDNLPVHVTGVVIAEVPGGTAGGDTVAGEFVAFSDEGGQFKQHETSEVSLADGLAAVHLG